ncbi:MAG: Smr domain [Gemmatimonadetes bacterium]|nr:Smr domain [Gemmatimonadota bacterium]
MAKRKRPGHPGVPREAWGAVHPQLDLHGLRAEPARREAEAWLRARQAEGVRTAVVVTGRGIHSAGMRPVLLGEIEHLLHGLRGTLVSSFAPVHGGGGFRVELRRPSVPPAPSRTSAPSAEPAALRGAGPELRRRAEEALWELGIAPTPALLEAELRRLLRERGPGEP